MIPVDEAVQRILASVQPLPVELVPLSSAAGRILAHPPPAPYPFPAFDNSAMDGYAVRSEDLTQASSNNPIGLRLIGTIPAGEYWKEILPTGSTLRIFTGSPLPPGADAVVMQEDVRRGPDQESVVFSEPITPWENIRFQGEEVKAGSPLLQRGHRLNFSALGLLKAVGLERVEVFRRARVGLIATGHELVESGQNLAPGKIFESNRLLLSTLIEGAGASVQSSSLIPDSPQALEAGLAGTFEQGDMVLSCGGVSVGDFDFVQGAFEKSGGTVNFWKVAMRPGKPFLFGRQGERLFFGLPGNPVSAAVTFLVLVLPALQKLQGQAPSGLPVSLSRLTEPLSNPSPRCHFVAVRFLNHHGVALAGRQSSHRLGTLAAADGLVAVPAKSELAEGSEVKVLRLPV